MPNAIAEEEEALARDQVGGGRKMASPILTKHVNHPTQNLQKFGLSGL